MTQQTSPVAWWYDRAQRPALERWLASSHPAPDRLDRAVFEYVAEGFLSEDTWRTLRASPTGLSDLRERLSALHQRTGALGEPAVVWVGALVFVAESVSDVSSLRLTPTLDQLFTVGLVRSLVRALVPEESPVLKRGLSELLAYRQLSPESFELLGLEGRKSLATRLVAREELVLSVAPPGRREAQQRLHALVAERMPEPGLTLEELNQTLLGLAD